MNGLQEQKRDLVSVEGLWRQTSGEQVMQTKGQPDGHSDEGRRVAFADLERRVVDRAVAAQSVSAAKTARSLSGPWTRVLWLVAGTVAWIPVCFTLRNAVGGQETLLEYLLLALVWGTIIGLTRDDSRA